MKLRQLIGVLAGAGVFAALVGAAAGSSTTNGSNAQRQSVKTITHNCTNTSSGSGGGMSGDDMDNDGDTITFSGPTVLWPPNHKYRTVTITASDSSTEAVTEATDPDYVTLATTATSNQAELGNGSGHTLNDTSPAMASTSGTETATQAIQLRGERDGVDPTKSGRTYTINAMATFDGSSGMANSMEHCSATFTVTVPHDMGQR
jgi:hypothetical protein